VHISSEFVVEPCTFEKRLFGCCISLMGFHCRSGNLLFSHALLKKVLIVGFLLMGLYSGGRCFVSCMGSSIKDVCSEGEERVIQMQTGKAVMTSRPASARGHLHFKFETKRSVK